MAGLGILIGWFGYSILYYGITQVDSGNWGYLDLIVPGRWTAATAATPKDSGGGGTPPDATGVASSGTGLSSTVNPSPYAPPGSGTGQTVGPPPPAQGPTGNWPGTTPNNPFPTTSFGSRPVAAS